MYIYNSYAYLDPDFTYTDSKTGILKNIQNITDPDVLLFIESSAVAKRIKELFDNPIKIKDSNSLLTIHHYLFQDVYAWAGKVRTVNPTQEDTSSGAKIICRRNTIPTELTLELLR